MGAQVGQGRRQPVPSRPLSRSSKQAASLVRFLLAGEILQRRAGQQRAGLRQHEASYVANKSLQATRLLPRSTIPVPP